jgi:hypothetical protein
MGTLRRKTVYSAIIGVLFVAGCGTRVGGGGSAEPDLGDTVGSLAEVFGPELIGVEGYGLVGGLQGTGSGECPPQIRTYLKQYILAQLPEPRADVEELISDHNTAVVQIRGTMPTATGRDKYFDLRVEALAGTRTASLEGGWLWRVELRPAGAFGIATKALAVAQGPVFIDTVSAPVIDKKMGYLLAGGRVLDEYRITLALRRADYRVARRISDLLNTRFTEGTANAVSAGVIELKVPPAYGEQKERFISIVKATYLRDTAESTEERVNTFVGKLAGGENDKDASETALEAIGRPALAKLAALLNSSNEETLFRAARCMLNIGSDEGLAVLRFIAMDKRSAYRIAALQAVTAAARRSDAASIARVLLRDEDFAVRLAAYEQLRKLDDVSITQELVGGKFFLEQVAQGHKDVYVSRSGQPRMVLFGAPINCRANIFVQSADGDITINAPAGQEYVSLMRKLPGRPRVAELRSSFDLSDIIRKLCEEPVIRDGHPLRSGLNVSYADAIGLLKQMCDSGVVEADFHAGPLPEIR